MVRDLRKLFVAIQDHRVVLYATNLRKFVQNLDEKFSGVKSYEYYRGRFSERKEIVHVTSENDVIYLQQLK